CPRADDAPARVSTDSRARPVAQDARVDQPTLRGAAMLKSILVVVGTYVLSVVLVLCSDPLLSALFPGDFVKGRVPSDTALATSTALFILISLLCAWLCARFSPQPKA